MIVDVNQHSGINIGTIHVAGPNTKFMGNGGQHAIATAAAAFLCTKYGIAPRGVLDARLAELQDIAGAMSCNGPRP